MALSPQQKQMIARKLDALGFPRPCSLCGGESWTVQDDIYVMPIVSGGALSLQKGLAVVPVICDTCTHTLLFVADGQ
ncbi:MAG TPA: hypothetical protein VGN26_12530 [Armatimonadota bacterium]|jgi:hypothetical protein